MPPSPPELVVATGDLTHRNRRADHERAAALLRSLDRPLLVVPGNHDIPPWSPQRFTRTFAAFRAEWPELEPVHRSEQVVVCGLNSVTPWKHQGGTVRRGQLEHAARVLAEAPAGALRVVALHHHMVGTTPAIYFVHYQGVGRAGALAATLHDVFAHLGHGQEATRSH